jgi:hypothetical protein
MEIILKADFLNFFLVVCRAIILPFNEPYSKLSKVNRAVAGRKLATRHPLHHKEWRLVLKMAFYGLHMAGLSYRKLAG